MKKEISKFVGSKIKYYRKMKGMTQKELGEKVGVKHNTISSYENGTNEPEQNVIYSIANVLDVSINEFFPKTDEQKSIVAEAQAPYGLRLTRYPLVPMSVSAGLPLCIDSIDEDDLDYISIPDPLMGKWAGRDIFMMKVNGDSMNRVITHGSLIGVKRTSLEELKNGDIVVYSDGGDYAVKRFHQRENKIIFRPDSTDDMFSDYETTTDNADLKIHGKVVMYLVELD